MNERIVHGALFHRDDVETVASEHDLVISPKYRVHVVSAGNNIYRISTAGFREGDSAILLFPAQAPGATGTLIVYLTYDATTGFAGIRVKSNMVDSTTDHIFPYRLELTYSADAGLWLG
jgi:hypothetical protein